MARTVKQTPPARSCWGLVIWDEYPVYVVGSAPELGEWNPNAALEMEYDGYDQEVAHRWVINLELPRGKEVEFKFIQKTDDGSVIWETGENRVFKATADNAMVEWGVFRQHSDAT